MTPARRLISVDDHVVEPPDLWQARLSAKHRERGPRVVRGGDPVRSHLDPVHRREVFKPANDARTCDWWHFEDYHMPVTRGFAAVGFAEEEVDWVGMTYDEMRPGCYDPGERLADMDRNSVEASVCFPNTIPRFCGQTFLWAKDKVLGLACVQAYNDWIVEEWCGSSGGRLVPVCLVPLWSAELAAAEVYRNAARGARAISFCELPAALDLPSIHDAGRHWDPLFRACDETGTVVCIHIGSSSTMPRSSPDAPRAVNSTTGACNTMLSLTDWLFSGLFERFPHLRVAFSEGEIGWIPFILERADRMWRTRPNFYDSTVVTRPPSSYYYDHVFGCFTSDQHGLDAIDVVGVDNVTFEVDYPHIETTWPNSLAVADHELATLDEEQKRKVLWDNARRLFSLDVGEAPAARS